MIQWVDDNHTYVQFENCGEPLSSHQIQHSHATISATQHTIRVRAEHDSVSQTSDGYASPLGMHTSIWQGCLEKSVLLMSDAEMARLDVACIRAFDKDAWKSRIMSCLMPSRPDSVCLCCSSCFMCSFILYGIWWLGTVFRYILLWKSWSELVCGRTFHQHLEWYTETAWLHGRNRCAVICRFLLTNQLCSLLF